MIYKKNIKKFILKFLSLFFILNILFFKISKYYFRIISILIPDINKNWLDAKDQLLEANYQKINHKIVNKNYSFYFYINNYLTYARVKSLFSKEPEIINWINNYGDENIFFDIGSNIGLYSVYYAKIKKGEVYTFEPSVFNTEVLVKNIIANELEDKVYVFNIPLSEKKSINNFNLQSMQSGHSGSSFGVNYGARGNKIKKISHYKTISLSIDDLFDIGLIKEIPKLVKIDVDGIEIDILKGGAKCLSHPQCHSIYIETFRNENSDKSKKINDILINYGFKLKKIVGINEIWIKQFL